MMDNEGTQVGLTGASLSEGGWRERSDMPEHPLGGGSGESYVQPHAGRGTASSRRRV